MPREPVGARALDLGQMQFERSCLLKQAIPDVDQRLIGLIKFSDLHRMLRLQVGEHVLDVIIVARTNLLNDTGQMLVANGAHVQLNARNQLTHIRVIARHQALQDAFELEPGHQGVLGDGVVAVKPIGQQGLRTDANNVVTLLDEPGHEFPVVVVALLVKAPQLLEQVRTKEKVGGRDDKVARHERPTGSVLRVFSAQVRIKAAPGMVLRQDGLTCCIDR